MVWAVDERRVASWQKLQRELDFVARREDQKARRAEQRAFDKRIRKVRKRTVEW